MWLLLIPVAVLIALAISAAVVATVFSILWAVWPWLLIGAGLWLLLRGSRYSRREWEWSGGRWESRGWHANRHAERAWRKSERWRQRDDRPAARWSDTVDAAPASTVSEPAPPRTPELPIDVQVKVQQIRGKVEQLLTFADRFPPFSHDLYLVKQTASDYLPRTIAAYQALPAGAETRSTPSGKTALEELRDQLNLLDAKLDEIADDLQRHDLDHLLANRRFLEERFQQREGGSVFERTSPIGDDTEGVAGRAI